MKYRFRSKIESSISFSRIHYLWYSLVLLFPPVHEFGHAAIAYLCGDKIINFGYWYVTMNHTNIFQSRWQYSPLISLGCVLLWVVLLFKVLDIRFKGFGCYGKKTTN